MKKSVSGLKKMEEVVGLVCEQEEEEEGEAHGIVTGCGGEGDVPQEWFSVTGEMRGR